MMKKSQILALVLVFCMAFVTLAGCAQKPTETTPAETSNAPTETTAPTTAATDAATDASALDKSSLVPHKIGVIFYGKDDPFAANVYRQVNRAGELLNCDITWAFGSMDPNDQITDAQNLIAAGVEGIMCVPLGEIATQKIMQLCEAKGVYFSICFRNIVDDEIRNEVQASSYWVGNSTEDNYNVGADIMQILHDQGATKVGLLLGVGEQSYEVERNQAFYDKAEELGMEVLAEATPLIGTNDAQSATENFLTSYPEMDGIAVTCGATGQGEIIVAAVERLNKAGQVKVGMCDTFTNMQDAYEKGSVSATAGGFSLDGFFNFMWLYNSVDGYPLSDKTDLDLIQNVIYVTSAEECEAYNKYIDTPDFDIYTDEEILSLVKRLNPDMNHAAMQEIMQEYNLDYVVNKAKSR